MLVPTQTNRRHTISKSTALVEGDKSQDVAVVDPAIAEILAAQAEQIDSDMLSTPLLKIGQPLTREVQEDKAEAGEFINTATGEGVGNVVEFVVAFYQKGRFAADRDTNRSYAANGTDLIPAHWADLVGEEFVGTRFDEHPDAEEQYKDRVNRKEIPWGKGPLISTTHVFTGLALVEDIETGEVEMQPVRLSLQRTNVPVVKKWMTLRSAKLRNRPFWDKTFKLGTQKNTFDKGMAYNLTVAVGRETTAEEREAALALAQAVMSGLVRDNAEVAVEEQVEPDAKGGLAV